MIVIGVILFALLVIIHELGHFIAARRAGVEVEEFGIGFPPRLFSRRYGKTLYSFNLIPLGGFVRLKGEADADRRPHSFGSVSLWSKTKILLAGVGMNILAVFVIILILAWTGLPVILPRQFSIGADEINRHNQVVIAQVEPDSPAAKANLKEGDRVIAINGRAISDAQSLRDTTAEFAGQTVELTSSDGAVESTQSAELTRDEDKGFLGVVPLDITKVRYSWAAPIVAAGLTMQLVGLTLIAIVGIVGSLLRGGGQEAADTVTGPVGVFFLLSNIGSFGFSFLLVLIASISASLAVVNGLPIPALDGGKLAVIAGARALRKKLTPQIENTIHGAGFIGLILLIILISYIDIQRFF